MTTTNGIRLTDYDRARGIPSGNPAGIPSLCAHCGVRGQPTVYRYATGHTCHPCADAWRERQPQQS